MSYAQNKERARTHNTDPSLADQSQAKETDINVIVGRYGISGQLPQSGAQPMYGDFSRLPTELRDFIEIGRTLDQRRRELPPELRDMPTDELLALTPEQLTTKLTPPAPTPAKTEEEPK